MTGWGTTGLALFAVLLLGLAAPCAAEAAQERRSTAQSQRAAAKSPTRHAARPQATTPARRGHAASPTAARRHRVATHASAGGMSCVPYARMVTGMQISGNGGQWWYSAAGTYDRGSRPEPGSILAFRATGRMSRGHVAVVNRVHGPRHIEIDHANWGGPGIRRGTIMRNVDVIDVSERNDWTQVRVQVGWDAGTYGSVYPTYGFIHNRPDRRMMTALSGSEAGTTPTAYEELAEAATATPSRRRGSR